MAYIVMAYTVMAYIVMTHDRRTELPMGVGQRQLVIMPLYSYGPYGYGLHSYGLHSYGHRKRPTLVGAAPA